MDNDIILTTLKKKYAEFETNNWDISDFVSFICVPLDALVYSKVLWPDFIMINDMVFLKDFTEDQDIKERLDRAIRTSNDKTQIEKSFNFFEIPFQFFSKHKVESTDEEDIWVAETLQEMWMCRLNFLFPERKFVVEILDSDETGGEIGIIFYQDR